MSKTYVPATLRREVRARADLTCEYCLHPEGDGLFAHEVEHVVAEKHRGETVSENLALACALCNKYKGTDLSSIDPETDQIERLFHPRKDRWQDHFTLNEDGSISPVSSIGRVTVFLLRLNRSECVEIREIQIRAGVLALPGINLANGINTDEARD